MESLNESFGRESSSFSPSSTAWHCLHLCYQAETLLEGTSARGRHLLCRQVCDDVMDDQTGFSQLWPPPVSLTTLQKLLALEVSE